MQVRRDLSISFGHALWKELKIKHEHFQTSLTLTNVLLPGSEIPSLNNNFQN